VEGSAVRMIQQCRRMLTLSEPISWGQQRLGGFPKTDFAGTLASTSLTGAM
jgi:hypothetical protein